MKNKLFFFAIIPLLLCSCGALENLNTHTVTFDTNGGSLIDTQKIKHGEKVEKPSDPTREGYTFNNWTYNGEEWSFVGYVVTNDMTLLANWNANTYELTLKNSDPNHGSISGAGSYAYDSDVTVTAKPKNGYSFVGWYDSDNYLVSDQTTYNFKMGLDLTLTANWTAIKYTLTVTSEDNSKGMVSIKSGGGYTGESITVAATPAEDCIFKGWYEKYTKVSDNATYSFTMPAKDYSLVAHFFTKEEQKKALGAIPVFSSDGKVITYGLYPQKHVNDPLLLEELKKLTTKETNGWYLYNNEYYARTSATPKKSNYFFDDETAIENGIVYWFKCEPISWNILNNNNGEYYLLSSLLLDTHHYYDTQTSTSIDYETMHVNSYKNSDIRAWLNNDFFNSAFALDSNCVQTTIVDNSAITTDSDSNSYACENTEDKVFLLSYKEYINSSYGFSSLADLSNTRYCKTTDWARARGVFYSTDSSYLNNGSYWTRSPRSRNPDGAWNIDYNGGFGYGYIGNTYLGVRPSISFKAI